MELQVGMVGTTSCRQVGEGPPLVLIHGVGADKEMWTVLAARLSGTRRVITYDMIGHGLSAKPEGTYALSDFVGQLYQLVQGLRLEKFDLLGFSMGGLVAQGFAVEHQNRLSHLILLNTVCDRSEAQRTAVNQRVELSRTGDRQQIVEAAIQRWFTPQFAKQHPDVLQRMRWRMAENDNDAYARAYAVFATADEELVPLISKIVTPTLVITGEDDSNSTPEMAHKLASLLPNGQATILARQRHMTPLEAPEELSQQILGFLCSEIGNSDGAKG